MVGLREPFPVVLTGPTGVGKTAVSLALADQLPLRVISADSMQVYRRMDIGTAKPTPDERRLAPHYGIDLVDPDQPFSVAEYVAHAAPAIRDTLAAGEWPIIVGGTRLYLKALTDAFLPGAPPDAAYREELTRDADERGLEALFAELERVDPPAASRIGRADRKRIIRALEVFRSSGKTITQVQDESRTHPPLFQALKIALVQEREALYRRVERRTAVLIERGWIAEVEGLVRDGYGPALEQTRAHGYRELAHYLEGRLTLAQAVETINRNVRHYVRYQLGWIRHGSALLLLEAGKPSEEIAADVSRLIHSPRP